MDKNTLSNYGWIVIAVLVLSVMIALATPFGQYVENAVWSATEGLFETQQNALESAGIIDNTEYIELSSEEDIYALSRILSKDETKTNYFGSDYNIETDFQKFQYPESVISNDEKIEYLSTASYKLTSNIELTIQCVNNTNFFIGVGSKTYPFKGVFNGNGHTVSIVAPNEIDMNGNMTRSIGFFAATENAKIKNVNMELKSDFLVNRINAATGIGLLAGHSYKSEIENCTANICNYTMGSDFADGETKTANVFVGGLIGRSETSIIKNCSVYINNGTIQAKGYDVNFAGGNIGNFSVGGLLGFSDAGCQNVDDATQVGIIGNQILNCKVISNNTTQRDVIVASIRTGEEIEAGGLIGCSYNNMVAKDCSVEIYKGNIIAQESGSADSTRGPAVGGIIGRLEHTGELYNCTVSGDYLNIVSRCSEGYTAAGGIVGFDMGPYHRDVTSLNKCSFNGNGTSKIIIDVVADSTINKWNVLGGIVGYGYYRIQDCSVKDTVLVNHSVDVDKCFVGGICGIYAKQSGNWTSGQFFTPRTPEIINCTANGITFDVSDNVKTNEIYAYAQ